jgi:hypothetical protein
LRSRRNNPQLKKKKDVPVKPFESLLHQGGIEQATFQEEASSLGVSLPPPSDILKNTVTGTDGVPSIH